MVPYGKQIISKDDINAVVDVLNSDFLTQGPCVEKFEKNIAKYVSSKYGFAVNSATSALHLACMAIGLQEGDIGWTCPNSFVASANCLRYCDAQVDFVDIDKNTFNMCPISLEKKLIQAKKDKKLPKVIIPVHFAGLPCDMKRIAELSKVYGFQIIEDASHAIGSSYQGVKTGACQYSDIAVFSFHPVKIITSGEGGMVLTNNDEIAANVKKLRTHGITKGINTEEPWLYEQNDLGFNYRMTDIHAALGNSQLNRLDEFVLKRNKLAEDYIKIFKDQDINFQQVDKDSYSSYHLFVIQLPHAEQRADVFRKLRSMGLGVNVHYIPIHTQPYYRRLGFSIGDFPVSEEYYNRAISLPLYPGLDFCDVEEITEKLFKAIQ